MINHFKKMRDKIDKLCALLRIKFLFQQDDTRIIHFDEGVWFYGCFSEAMSFSKFATSVSKVTIDVPKIFHCWLPQVKCLLLLWKTKGECNVSKEKHSLRNSAVLQSREGTQRNSTLPQSWLLIQKKQIFKMTLLQKNGSRIKMPSSK